MEEKIKTIASVGKPEETKEVIIDDCPAPVKLQLLQPFGNVEFVSLTKCSITNLKGFPKLPLLKKLDLSSNTIASTLFFLNGCSGLNHLNLSNNKISDAHVLKPLGKLKQLQSLILANCEVTKTDQYRRKVFHFVKFLKNLDGVDKTTEDAEPPVFDAEDPMNGRGVKRGKKRKSKEMEQLAKKMKMALPQKNALMQLNERKPGLKYHVQDRSGPPHTPQFSVFVEVDGTKYVGHGSSKQLAKHAAAAAALVAFGFHAEPTMGIKSEVVQDFTMDSMENEDFNFGKFEAQKNGSEGKKRKGSNKSVPKEPLKILTEAEKKNPVMLLNELHPGLSYKLEEENSNVPSQRFRMSVDVDGQMYDGTGPNKKLAKQSCARCVLSNLYKVAYNTYAASYLPTDPADAVLFDFPQAVADKIAKQLLSTYNDVMEGSSEFIKWKIIAGIAMTKDKAMEEIQIISIGTGTKCISGEHISMIGANLNDCHAEIISRRCLKDFLYTNLELHLEGEGDQSIFMKKAGGGFSLLPNVKFHLYISTAPCGDARIFCPHEEGMLDAVDRHPNRNSRGVLRTKIESGEGTIPIKSGHGIQTWDGILPGQDRLLTMSCSDKIAAWNVLGLQGALLNHFLEPIYLDSVILGGLFHPNHMSRALFRRFESTLKDLPPMFKLNKPKLCAISSPETRHLIKSPNYSVNWTLGLGRAEIVNATTGKTEGGQVSRLSKRSFFQRFMNIQDRLPHLSEFAPPQPGLYSSFKVAMKQYQLAKKAVANAFSEAGLGTWTKKPVEQNEFELVF